MTKINEEWKMYADGGLKHKSGYIIEHHTLDDKDWILHIMGKIHMNLDNFIPAYFKACKHKGINELSIKTSY